MPLTVLDEFSKNAIAASAIFDADWYSRRYRDVAKSGLMPIEHYLAYGIALRRSPGPEFDPAYYQAQDEALSGLDGLGLLMHYLEIGRRQARRGAAFAEAGDRSRIEAGQEWYLTGNLDKAAEDMIVGWALDRRRPNEPVDLELWIDRVRVMEVRTSLQRVDVVADEGGGGRAGFIVHVPPGSLRAGQSIEVRFKDSARALPGGPLFYSSAGTRGDLPLPLFVRYHRTSAIRPTTIVVPVYNAPSAVEGCLASLASMVLPEATQVLVVDDASTDPGIRPLLERFTGVPGFKVVWNERNIGYTRTINMAIGMCIDSDVVLLNSDTVVTERWLHNLRYTAYSQPDIATVTPLSDNAGAFSAPDIGVHNPVPAHLDHSRMARRIVQTGAGYPLDVPTGNGFCLFIKREAIDDVGLFDEAGFPRGYGEENDLCMRMLHSGWRNVVCDKSYVFHLRTQSFGNQKDALVSAGSAELARLHPEYAGLTRRFTDLQFSLLRSRIRLALDVADGRGPLRRILFVLSTTTGGTPQANLDLMRAISGYYDCFLLRSDSTQVVLSRLINDNLEPVETRPLHFRINQVPHRSEEYDRVIGDLLYRYSIDLVHIRHVAWHGLGLASVAKMLDLPVVYSFHDFYALCPSVNLLDTDNIYRGTSFDGDRLNPLWSNNHVPAKFLPRWRHMMGAFLADCDSFVTTSKAAASLATEAYPFISERMLVIPHGRDFQQLESITAPRAATQKLKVLVPGNISPSKGALLIESIAGLAGEGIEFHFLGRTDDRLKPIGVHHGSYRREEFSSKVREICPQIGIVFSVCPETYCHTLTEMWASGIPVLALDIGAVGERIRHSGAGWLVAPESSPQMLLSKLFDIRNDPSDQAAKIACVYAWQQTSGIHDNTHAMGFRYRQEYSRLLGMGRVRPLRVGLVVKRRASGSPPPTAYIRLIRPMIALERRGDAIVRMISADEIVAGGAVGLDIVVIQRDAVPAARTDGVLEALERSGTPHTFEIDDMLWDIPASHTDHDIDSATIDAMDKVARAATMITTSTQAMSERLVQRYGKPTRVIQNALDELLWLAPIEADRVRQICGPLGLGDDRRRILYMGSDSHARDLEMLDGALRSIRSRFPDIQILQIGGGRPLSYAKCVTRPPEAGVYPGFVTWFRAIASRCTLAVAPLLEDDFSTVKSGIKHLDYVAAGLFGIYSNVPAYRSTVIDGVTGKLCPNEQGAWEDAISRQLERADAVPGSHSEEWRNLLNASTISGSASCTEWREALESARHLEGVGGAR